MGFFIALCIAPLVLWVLALPAWALWRLCDAAVYRITGIEGEDNSYPCGFLFVCSAFCVGGCIVLGHHEAIGPDKVTTVAFWIASYWFAAAGLLAIVGVLGGIGFVLGTSFELLIRIIRGSEKVTRV